MARRTEQTPGNKNILQSNVVLNEIEIKMAESV
jgi:hypothetical protein